MQHAMPGQVTTLDQVPAGTCFICTSGDGMQIAVSIATSSGDAGFVVLNQEEPVLYHSSALETETVLALPDARIIPDMDFAKVRIGQHRQGSPSVALYLKDENYFIVTAMREGRHKVVNLSEGATSSVDLADAVHFLSWRIAVIGLDGYPETVASFTL